MLLNQVLHAVVVVGCVAPLLTAQAQAPRQAAPPPPSSADSSRATSNSELMVATSPSASLGGHASRRFGLSFSFPNGGSFFDGAAAGGRYFLSESTAVHAAALISHSKAKETTSLGIMGRFLAFLQPQSRLSPYFFGGAALGHNGGDAPKAAKTDGVVLGLMGGLGTELWILPELSFFGEVGVNLALVPSDSFEFTTFTSKLGINFNFEKF